MRWRWCVTSCSRPPDAAPPGQVAGPSDRAGDGSLPRSRSFPQAWGKTIHDHPERLDAILYTSRHDETTFSIALFSRARHKIVEDPSTPLAVSDVRTLLLLKRYGLGLTM